MSHKLTSAPIVWICTTRKLLLLVNSVTVWRETEYYTEQERTILAWTESVTLISQTSAEQQFLFENLCEYFDPEDIANLILAITQINSWTRLAKFFGFEAGSYEVGLH